MKKLILLSVFAFFLQTATAQTATDQPNIIWLMAEDISLDLECYGMEAVKTPILNKMAEEGVRFDNCYVTNPICSPSRSAMMVGTHQTKINAHNHRSNRDVPLDENYKPWLLEVNHSPSFKTDTDFDYHLKLNVIKDAI